MALGVFPTTQSFNILNMVLWHFLYLFEYVHDISKPTFIMWNVSDVWRIIEKGLTNSWYQMSSSLSISTIILWGCQQWQAEDDLGWMFHKLFGLHRSNRLIWLAVLNVLDRHFPGLSMSEKGKCGLNVLGRDIFHQIVLQQPFKKKKKTLNLTWN